ncbi:MAG: sigma-70 family RNA polymerase sigma factor [Bacteroidales bacterium]
MAKLPGERTILAIKEYGQRLYRFIRGRVKTNEDAEDILQDVWLQLNNAIDISDIGQLSGWLYKVARNKITDNYRKKRTEALEDYSFINGEGEIEWLELLIEGTDNPELEFIRNLFWEEFNLALEELPEKQREVFILNELEGFTLKEIADEKGENLKTIISRKVYAVNFLREKLDKVYRDIRN